MINENVIKCNVMTCNGNGMKENVIKRNVNESEICWDLKDMGHQPLRFKSHEMNRWNAWIKGDVMKKDGTQFMNVVKKGK